MITFPLFNPEAPMIGRKSLHQKVLSELTKETPQHISLVGPRYSGKTVMLRELARKIVEQPSAYQAVIYWDLGHGTPQNDSDFISMLRNRIADALEKSHPKEAEYLKAADSSGFFELDTVIQSLGKKNCRLLIIWDGFDRPLREAVLTRNLWDNLLELCRKPAFRALTASRRELQQLIRDANSVTSEFWHVFRLMRLKPMTAEDIAEFASEMENHKFEENALSGVMNWTGGQPVLIAWLMNQVGEQISEGTVSCEHIDKLAGSPDDQCRGALEDLWKDCRQAGRDLYQCLHEVGPQNTSDVPKPAKASLIDLGLVQEEAGLLFASCEMLKKHIEGEGVEFGALGRLFGTWEVYEKNIREILSNRLAQIERFDDRLFYMVEDAIEKIPRRPYDCLTPLTQIQEGALDIIWKWETDNDGNIREKVLKEWFDNPEDRQHNFVKQIKSSKDRGGSDYRKIPPVRSRQLTLLQLLTGSNQFHEKPMAKYITKDTYVLMSAIQSFRNRSQHASGQQIHLGVAVSGLMLCVELLDCLARESPNSKNNPK
jgi:hypothetical protein